MYSKEFRLPVEDFKNTKIRTGQMVHSKCFILKTKVNNEGHNRYGIIISKSVVNKSVDRHHWKRFFADQLKLWPNVKKDFLLIISPRLASEKKEIVKLELDRAKQSIINN